MARAEQAAAEQAAAEQVKVAARRGRVQDSEEHLAKQRETAMARWEDYQRRRAEAQAQGSPPPNGRPPASPDEAFRTRRALARLNSDRARLAKAETATARAEPVKSFV